MNDFEKSRTKRPKVHTFTSNTKIDALLVSLLCSNHVQQLTFARVDLFVFIEIFIFCIKNVRQVQKVKILQTIVKRAQTLIFQYK